MELEDRGHAAMADRYALGAEIGGGETEWTDDGVIYASASDFPVIANAAIPLGGDPRALAAAARESFDSRGRGFSFFARTPEEDEAAGGAGMHRLLERYPAMVLRDRVDEREVAGVELSRVGDDAATHDYANVGASALEALGMPREMLADIPPAALIRDDTASFV